MGERKRQLWVNKAAGTLVPGVEDAIRAMHGERVGDREMAERMGVSVSAVSKIRRQLGLVGHGSRKLEGDSVTFNVRFSAAHMTAMRAAADAAGVTLRDWVRERCRL